ncbi:GNAT family N-acetyltransferase [Clostridium sp. LP20]|uniref:GNAT family N-acetyltransferase n=1 Tax=Clostridium sp. LP20 TaxID=3418665 RepID=UPI003EE60BDF
MSYYIQLGIDGINWKRVSELLSYYGLSDLDPDKQEEVFQNSYGTAFAFHGNELIGVGRVLSDGISQAAIYNIALDEKYHGLGIGKGIINALISEVKDCNIILYTHPQTIDLYEHLGFRRMKTGMAIYQSSNLDEMEDEGFLLPYKYRFGDNYYERKF